MSETVLLMVNTARMAETIVVETLAVYPRMDTARSAETSRFEVVLMVNTARMAETRRMH